MVVLRHEEHRPPANGARHGITKEAFFHHQHAGGARPAHKLVAGKKYRVLSHQSLNSEYGGRIKEERGRARNKICKSVP